MKPRPATQLMLAILTMLFVVAGIAAQSEDIYLINSGQVWRWPPRGNAAIRPSPYRITFPPGMPRISSLAIDGFNNGAYVNSGFDGDIYKIDGVRATRIFSHNGQVRQIAVGGFSNTLYFSVVETPQDGNPVANGQIYTLNLSTRRAVLRFTVRQSAVDNAWWGAFTVVGEQVYLGTFSGGIYQMRTEGPALIYRNAGDQIHGIAAELGAFVYTTGGAEVYRVRRLRDREVALNLPGSRLTHLSYVPLTDGPRGSCELIVQLNGDDPELIRRFYPVIRGPNLHWFAYDLFDRGRGGTHRLSTLPGTYWVSMTTRGDTSRVPQPREQRVECTGDRAEVTFSF